MGQKCVKKKSLSVVLGIYPSSSRVDDQKWHGTKMCQKKVTFCCAGNLSYQYANLPVENSLRFAPPFGPSALGRRSAPLELGHINEKRANIYEMSLAALVLTHLK